MIPLLAETASEKFMPDMPAVFYVPAFGYLIGQCAYWELKNKWLIKIVFKALKVAVPGDD